MTRKSIQRNIKALEGTLRANRNRLTPTTKQKVRDVIELYEDRKIAQVSTASKMINELVTATTKKDKERARANYEKLVERHESKKPLGERMEASKKENTEKGRFGRSLARHSRQEPPKGHTRLKSCSLPMGTKRRTK